MFALKLIAKHSEDVSVLLKKIDLAEKGKDRSKKETH